MVSRFDRDEEIHHKNGGYTRNRLDKFAKSEVGGAAARRPAAVAMATDRQYTSRLYGRGGGDGHTEYISRALAPPNVCWWINCANYHGEL